MLAAVLGSITAIAVAAPANADDLFYFPFRNVNGKCLQPVDGTTEQGAAIVQEPCDLTNPAQRWAFDNRGGTTYHFINQVSHMCMDARGGATNGTPIQQWTCNSITNENWDTGVAPLPPPVPLVFTVPVKSRVSGTSSHCLDIPWNQPLDGLAMQLWGCNGTDAQAWVFGG